MDKHRAEKSQDEEIITLHWMVSSPWAIFWLLLTPLISMIDFSPNRGQIYTKEKGVSHNTSQPCLKSLRLTACSYLFLEKRLSDPNLINILLSNILLFSLPTAMLLFKEKHSIESGYKCSIMREFSEAQRPFACLLISSANINMYFSLNCDY